MRTRTAVSVSAIVAIATLCVAVPAGAVAPLGVLTVTFAVPAEEITAVVIVNCNWVLLVTKVLSATPLMTPTEDETN